jgi:hypothetical protein
MANTLGFTDTAFDSADNTGNPTLFAPTVIDVTVSDLSLAITGLSVSADYVVDTCLTIDASWARAALRWLPTDATDGGIQMDFSHSAADTAISAAVKQVLEGALQTVVIVASNKTNYPTNMATGSQQGNTGNAEEFNDHVLAYCTHVALGRADLRHVVLNGEEVKSDVSAGSIADTYQTNLGGSTDARADGQVMLELLNQWDTNNNDSGRFAVLNELSDIDVANGVTNPFPLASDDKLCFKVRVHGVDGTTDTIDANQHPGSSAAGQPAGNDGVTYSSGDFDSATISPATWIVRIGLGNADTDAQCISPAGQNTANVYNNGLV